jgi:hypothetical protein
LSGISLGRSTDVNSTNFALAVGHLVRMSARESPPRESMDQAWTHRCRETIFELVGLVTDRQSRSRPAAPAVDLDRQGGLELAGFCAASPWRSELVEIVAVVSCSQVRLGSPKKRGLLRWRQVGARLRGAEPFTRGRLRAGREHRRPPARISRRE